MYGSSEGVAESQGGSLQPGVHIVSFKEISVTDVSTANYTGQVIDVVYEDKGGTTSTRRIFPFAFQPSWTDRNGVNIPEDVQRKQYLGKNLHMFKYALDGSDQTYFATVAGSNDLPTYVSKLQKCLKANGGKEFKILVVAEKGKYPKYPWWQGGCTANATDDITFNPEKHGYKQKDENAMEAASGGETTDKLPF
jgi:hypothetical protein